MSAVSLWIEDLLFVNAALTVTMVTSGVTAASYLLAQWMSRVFVLASQWNDSHKNPHLNGINLLLDLLLLILLLVLIYQNYLRKYT